MHRRLSLILLAAFLLVGCDSNQSAIVVPPAKDIWLSDPDENVGTMSAVKVISYDDIWAVGVTATDTYKPRPQDTANALIAHWDGNSWQVMHTFGDVLADYV